MNKTYGKAFTDLMRFVLKYLVGALKNYFLAITVLSYSNFEKTHELKGTLCAS